MSLNKKVSVILDYGHAYVHTNISYRVASFATKQKVKKGFIDPKLPEILSYRI